MRCTRGERFAISRRFPLGRPLAPAFSEPWLVVIVSGNAICFTVTIFRIIHSVSCFVLFVTLTYPPENAADMESLVKPLEV